LTVRNIGDVSLFFSFYLIFTVPVQARRSAVQKTARDGARSCRFVHIQFMATGRDRPVTLHCAKTKKRVAHEVFVTSRATRLAHPL
jgi:hypothetical protein